MREQEKQLSRQGVEDYALRKQRQAEEEAKQDRYQEYLEKQRQIEHLKELKAQEMEKAGLAMRQAEESEKMRLEAELAKK